MKNVEISQFYDTLLCIPGMNETVKIDLRISRKSILLFTQLVEHSLTHPKEEAFTHLMSEDTKAEIKELLQHCLDKSMLVSLHEKLQTIQKHP